MRISDWSSDVCSSDLIHVTDNFGLATAVTGEWCRAQNDDAGRCRRVPDNREMVGWKIRVRSERPTPSSGPDDPARVAQRPRLPDIGRGIQDYGHRLTSRNGWEKRSAGKEWNIRCRSRWSPAQ